MRTLFLITAITAGLTLPASAAGGRLKAMDLNKDGTVTTAEAVEARMAGFAKADGNSDGQLSRAEYDAMVAAMKSQRKHGGSKGAERDGFGFADADGNDAISKAEYRSAAERIIQGLDADGSGTLTRADFKALRAKRGG
jgi:Ca2+-binding EF-hand superfamily protein